VDLAETDQELMREIRGNEIGMIFQEPMTALNPVFTVGRQLTEGLRLHKGMSKAEAEARALELLTQVRIPQPDRRLKQYPHELSGGMRKRAGLARALALDPQIVFLDEPTAGLDPIGAADFDQLILGLSRSLGLTVFLVTHDLDTLHAICDRIAVLAEKRVLVTGTMQEMLKVDHPWVHDYFHGVRARAALDTKTAADVATKD
jgi:ABC-type transporter Mla maintaining outer membrane lipid asymmetry ATPase subunit MlaF